MICLSHSLAETSNVAQQVLQTLADHPSNVLALHGDLGAGKTAFTQALAKRLGIQERITSPTFVIQKRYELRSGKDFEYEHEIESDAENKKINNNRNFKNLIHIDAYRLEKGSDLLVLGWHEIVSDSTNLIVLEWPEIVQDILPKNMLHVYFTFIDEGVRKIEWQA